MRKRWIGWLLIALGVGDVILGLFLFGGAVLDVFPPPKYLVDLAFVIGGIWVLRRAKTERR